MPVASIALIRGRTTGNGSEILLSCDMSFVSREKTIISNWEVGVGMVAGGGPMARLPQLIGRNRLRTENAALWGGVLVQVRGNVTDWSPAHFPAHPELAITHSSQ